VNSLAKNYFRNVAISSNGNRLTSTSDGTMVIYDATPLPEKP